MGAAGSSSRTSSNQSAWSRSSTASRSTTASSGIRPTSVLSSNRRYTLSRRRTSAFVRGLLIGHDKDIVIKIRTGDRHGAGIDASIKIVLHDEDGNCSEPITLHNSFGNDFEWGSENTFKVPGKKIRALNLLGEITRVEFWRDRWLTMYIKWFVDTITVTNNVTEESYVFPVLRWVQPNIHYRINGLDTSLPQHDECREQRLTELENKKKIYVFDQKIENGPVQVEHIPPDEHFSTDYIHEIKKLKMKLKAVAKIECLTTGEFETLADIQSIYTEGSSLFYRPRGADGWNNDAYFGLQRVAGLNHSLIRLVTTVLPFNFPVTDSMVKPLLEGLTLQKAIDAKRLFICDLKIMEELSVKEGLTMCAPIALFFLNQSDELKPIAIQLFQTPSRSNPIFTPTDSFLTWTLAKMWFNNADAGYHQALTHLGMTHILMEGVTVATHRNLSQSHPVFRLLAPHFMFLIAINSRALNFLVNPGGYIDNNMTYGVKGLFELVTRRFKTWRMDIDGWLPTDLKERGLDDLNILSCYHFRNDALLVHSAIKKYVTAYVNLYYTSDSLLHGDEEIQNWASELVKERNKSEGGVGILGVPGGGKLTHNDQLIKILTCIIYTCSVSHAASNFPQYDEYGFPANYPALLRGTPPSKKTAITTEKDILASLPDKHTTLESMLITKILSTKGTKSLGDFEVQYIFDPAALDVVQTFRKDLKAISATIKSQNRKRSPRYDYLDPEFIPNSISI